MNKKASKRAAPARRTATSKAQRKIQSQVKAKDRVQEDIAATPTYRRAKTIVGIAGTLGMALIAIRATRNWWNRNNEDLTDD